MADSKLLCRLCMRTGSVKFIGDASLLTKIELCIDIKINPDDHLPTTICKLCKKRIKKYYNFKLNCLKVDLELRSLMCQASKSEIEINKVNLQSEPNINYLQDSNMDLKDFYNYVPPDVQSNVNHDNYGTENIKDNVCELNNESLNENNNKSNVPNQIQCELCGCILETKAEFKKHSLSHSKKDKLYSCKFCPKQFTRAENSNVHMRSHMGIRPFICEICGQSATKQQDLARHMKVHSEERKHACPHCGRRFKRSGDLCSHIRTHTGARPFKCKFCGKDYTSHNGLKRHSAKHNCIILNGQTHTEYNMF